MSLSKSLVLAFFRGLTSVICRFHDEQLSKVPQNGPLIIICNHVNLLEIPVLFTRLQPRSLRGFAAAKRWDALWSRWLLETCDAIPLHRGEADLSAIREAIKQINEGHIFMMAPEGTRSYDGRLQKGNPGAVLLALRTDAPIMPLVFYGGENYVGNLLHLRKTDFHIRVGEPFQLNVGGTRINSEVRQDIIDEMMYRMAALLPPQYRGVYADLGSATTRFFAS
ncbi:MAG: hypothetical protein GTO18_16780 [Anaerolineales bacterium]|nr:hypothetical protein [Anaerolineales bacterium]